MSLGNKEKKNLKKLVKSASNKGRWEFQSQFYYVSYTYSNSMNFFLCEIEQKQGQNIFKRTSKLQ